MRRPLYRFPDGIKPVLQEQGNAGLWYDKFCDKWTSKNNIWSLDNNKLAWIKTVTGESGRKVGDKGLIEEVTSRIKNMVKALGGDSIVLEVKWRFVAGLGRSHPVENGFAWHHTLGVPYLPGSSVKGVLRDWARNVGVDAKEIERIFGVAGKEGAVCFLDALPVCPPKLVADVMTSHYANWTENDPPGDWHSPNPIFFMATDNGSRFLFCAIPHTVIGSGTGDDDGPGDEVGAKNTNENAKSCSLLPSVSSGDHQVSDDLKTVMCWLKEALEWAGAGAKTAVGYGRFREPTDEAASLERDGLAATRARAGETAGARPSGLAPHDLPLSKRLSSGETVKAFLLEERTRRGGWKARLAADERVVGPIVNSNDVPGNVAPGQEVTLLVHAVGVDGSVIFKWPTEV